ncbi:MAG: hypothetical protein KY450_06370 [Actinobacteria bacterium]|nr:hypothetical protein [Actinomycetota bacterium]
MTAQAVAAIDCGTNSTRLLVARPGDGGHWETLERSMAITRLGAGVGASATLAPAAIARTVEVLQSYRSVLDRHGVERLRITATSAARDAVNRNELFDAADTQDQAGQLLVCRRRTLDRLAVLAHQPVGCRQFGDRLLGLAVQAGVLDRDHRLGRQELGFGEITLLERLGVARAAEADDANRLPMADERHREQALVTEHDRQGSRHGIGPV